MAQNSFHPSTQLLVFQLDATEYALPLQNVREVLRMVAFTPVPEPSAWLIGVINLRGRILPLIDLRKRLALNAQPYTLTTPIIVAEANGRTLGLIADAVSTVLTIPAQAFTPAHALLDTDQPTLGIARTDERLIVVLDPARLLAGAEDVIHEGH